MIYSGKIIKHLYYEGGAQTRNLNLLIISPTPSQQSQTQPKKLIAMMIRITRNIYKYKTGPRVVQGSRLGYQRYHIDYDIIGYDIDYDIMYMTSCL